MSLDHGMLNLPLRQRGEINAQLDRYKHEQVVKARGERTAKAAETRDLKAQAKQALGEINAALGLIEAKAAALGVTRRALVSQLTEWSKWQPANLLKLHRLWIEQPK